MRTAPTSPHVPGYRATMYAIENQYDRQSCVYCHIYASPFVYCRLALNICFSQNLPPALHGWTLWLFDALKLDGGATVSIASAGTGRQSHHRDAPGLRLGFTHCFDAICFRSGCIMLPIADAVDQSLGTRYRQTYTLASLHRLMHQHQHQHQRSRNMEQLQCALRPSSWQL